jgi:hypothetical protein
MPRLITSALLLGSAALLAQSSSNVVIITSPTSQNCPVGLAARHSSQGAVRQIGQHPIHSQIGYTVTFTPANLRSITQAQLTFHGISGAHIIPAGSDNSGNATEDLTVAPTAADHRFESVVYAQKLTGVQWIELDDLTFADGTHWHKSPTSACIAAPNGFMLVNAEAPSHPAPR